jgi:hypothetical protein
MRSLSRALVFGVAAAALCWSSLALAQTTPAAEGQMTPALKRQFKTMLAVQAAKRRQATQRLASMDPNTPEAAGLTGAISAQSGILHVLRPFAFDAPARADAPMTAGDRQQLHRLKSIYRRAIKQARTVEMREFFEKEQAKVLGLLSTRRGFLK